ncbi:MAG: hypothetical protein HY080_14600 [Gammaproteobacteria bacterium]|nr:hypothetical protein [Gammaproteobacteria bacterium]
MKIHGGRIGLCGLMLAGLLLPAGCGGGGGNTSAPGSTRSYFMGFTPFWASSAAPFGDWKFDWSTNADLVSLHADDFFGIPWSEFAKADPALRTLHPAWVKKWDDWFRAARATGHPVLVSLSPLSNRTRLSSEVDHLTGNPVNKWDSVVTDPTSKETQCYAFTANLTDPWTQAYINYVTWINATYKPENIIIAIEANIQFYKCPAYKDGFKRFLTEVYNGVKAAGVTVPVFSSFEFEAMYGNGLSGALSNCGTTPLTDCATQRMGEAVAISGDAIGISTYPQNWYPRTSTPPVDRFDRLHTLTNKPIWISETGWNVAQVRISYSDTTQCNVAANLYFDSASATAGRQTQWMNELLATADRNTLAGVVWWLPKDYLDTDTASTCPCSTNLNTSSADTCTRTALFQTLGAEFFYRAFGNMGLWEQNGRVRPALAPWQAKLALPRR